jgi:hypothetical protein
MSCLSGQIAGTSGAGVQWRAHRAWRGSPRVAWKASETLPQ